MTEHVNVQKKLNGCNGQRSDLSNVQQCETSHCNSKICGEMGQ